MSRLKKLRNELEQIDQNILDGVRRRMETARQIGEEKSRHGLPIQDFRMEREVIDRAREFCRTSGLNEEVGERVVRVLIHGATQIQEDLRLTDYSGKRQQILIVGGSGQMGGWFVHYFHSQGHDIVISDPKGPLEGFKHEMNLERGAQEAEIIVFATPLSATDTLLRRAIEVRSDALLMDICSVKDPLLDTIREGVEEGERIVSLHPLFGPRIDILTGNILCLCHCGHDGAYEDARALFSETGLTLVDLGLEEHDRLMACVLGLSHAVNLVFAGAIRESPWVFEQLDQVASTTFRKQVSTVRDVVCETPRVYYDIQHLNRHSEEALAWLESALQDLRDAVRSPDSSVFQQLMERSRQFFGW